MLLVMIALFWRAYPLPARYCNILCAVSGDHGLGGGEAMARQAIPIVQDAEYSARRNRLANSTALLGFPSRVSGRRCLPPVGFRRGPFRPLAAIPVIVASGLTRMRPQ